VAILFVFRNNLNVLIDVKVQAIVCCQKFYFFSDSCIFIRNDMSHSTQKLLETFMYIENLSEGNVPMAFADFRGADFLEVLKLLQQSEDMTLEIEPFNLFKCSFNSDMKGWMMKAIYCSKYEETSRSLLQ
jgi:hypothetical protein